MNRLVVRNLFVFCFACVSLLFCGLFDSTWIIQLFVRQWIVCILECMQTLRDGSIRHSTFSSFLSLTVDTTKKYQQKNSLEPLSNDKLCCLAWKHCRMETQEFLRKNSRILGSKQNKTWKPGLSVRRCRNRESINRNQENFCFAELHKRSFLWNPLWIQSFKQTKFRKWYFWFSMCLLVFVVVLWSERLAKE